MIGDKLKKRRIALGWTQEELAHRLGYKSKSTINKIELNVHDVSQSKLLRFAEVLGCEPIDLLDEPKHVDHASADIRKYAAMLAALPPAALDNAIQYIEYLSNRKEGD